MSSAHSISGTSTCLATGDFTSFNDDPAQVVIANANGTTVAAVNAGKVEQFNGGCIRWFTAQVPAGGGFYTARFKNWTSAVYAEKGLSSKTLALVLDSAG